MQLASKVATCLRRQDQLHLQTLDTTPHLVPCGAAAPQVLLVRRALPNGCGGTAAKLLSVVRLRRRQLPVLRANGQRKLALVRTKAVNRCAASRYHQVPPVLATGLQQQPMPAMHYNLCVIES